MSRVSEAVARPTRTLTQGGAGLVVVEVIEAYELYDFTDRQYGITVLLLGAAISAIQNFGENRGWWKAFLRTVPPTKAEVVDEVDHA